MHQNWHLADYVPNASYQFLLKYVWFLSYSVMPYDLRHAAFFFVALLVLS